MGPSGQRLKRKRPAIRGGNKLFLLFDWPETKLEDAASGFQGLMSGFGCLTVRANGNGDVSHAMENNSR
jgi:hypothetical protein